MKNQRGKPNGGSPLRQNAISLLAIGFATFCPLYVLALWTLAPLTVMNCLPLQQRTESEAYSFLAYSGFICAGANGITVSVLLCWRMIKGRIRMMQAHLTVLWLLLICCGITALNWLLGLLLVDVLEAGEGVRGGFLAYCLTIVPLGSTLLSVRTLRYLDEKTT